MIYNIEQKSKLQLVAIVDIQQEEYKKLLAENESLREQLKTAKAYGVEDALSFVTGWYDWEWECVSATDLQKLLIEYVKELRGAP